jgi:dimethylglycine dehydrogenase
MKSHARVVVIGGGVVGASTLYHLVKKGWDDVVLVERKELTSGSTWHAAGLLPLFNLSYSVGQIHRYSVDLYNSIEAETGQNVGLRKVSNIRLARTQYRLDEYKYYAGVAKTIGVDVNFLTPEEVSDIWPLYNPEGIIGAIQHPDDGYVQPADLTQAFAKGARAGGAEIYRYTTVLGIDEKPNGEYVVKTDKGDITCEHIVCCTGSFARKTGAMLGLDIPVLPVEHQYIVTEPHDAIRELREKGLPEMGVLRESDSSWYMREENGGLLLGPYEIGAPACYVDGPSDESEYELFQEDLDRLMPYIETAIERVPAFGEVGIKQVYNGAIAYTPDGSPIIGPAWNKKNVWLNEGHSFGITAAGGAGWQLAEWMVEGEPSIDMMGVDPRRFGPYASRGYLKEKCEEAYAAVFTVHYPDEERAAARPLKTSPCYSRMKALGAVFGSVYGWERPNWFAPEGYELSEADLNLPEVLLKENHSPALEDGRIVEKYSFRRSNYFEHVGNEVKNTTENAGLLDLTAFAKAEVKGPGAEAWLNSITTNKMPLKTGRIILSYLLSESGGVLSEFSVLKTGDQSYYLVFAGALERHDYDYLQKLLPDDGSVSMELVTTKYGVLVLTGPKARQILQKVTDTDLSNESFPWLTGQPISIARASAMAVRVNFVGELGWELHHPIEQQNAIFDALMEAGAEHGLKPYGIRAMDSMRLEKTYKFIARELSIEYSALESGLDRFINNKKNDYRGKAGLQAREDAGRKWQLVTMEVHDVTDADARGSEAIYKDGEMVGRATSGGYGWRLEKSLALAMVPPAMSGEGEEFEIEILGNRHRATIIGDSPFDPTNERLRS